MLQPTPGQAASLYHPARTNDRDPNTELLNLAEDTTGQQNGGNVRADSVNMPPEHRIHERIPTGTGLIYQFPT